MPHLETTPECLPAMGPMLAPLAWRSPSWIDASDTLARDLTLLVDHVQVCRQVMVPWVALRCAVRAGQSFVAAHLLTTVVMALVAGAIVSVSL